MRVKKTINIFMGVFDIIYKLLMYFAVVAFFLVIVLYLIYLPTVKPIISEILNTGIKENISTAFNQFIRFNDEYVNSFSIIERNIEDIGNIIQSKLSILTVSLILIVLIFAVAQFIWNLCYFSTSDIVNLYMNSYMHDNLLTNIIRNLKTCSKYSLVNICINLPFNVFFVFFMFLSFNFSIGILKFFSPAFVICVGVTIWAIKHVLISNWLPILANEKISVLSALKDSIIIGFKHFFELFKKFWMSGLVVFIIMLNSILVTFGLAIIITLPASMLYFKVYEMVIYYDRNKLKYYLNESHVQQHQN